MLARLREAVSRSLADPATQERFLKSGTTVPKPERQGGDYMLKLVGSEVGRWDGIIKRAGVTAPPQ